MAKYRLFFLILAVALCLNVTGQPTSGPLDGTMRPYDFSLTDTVVPWGSDMKPVFINYVARHGARFLSSEKKISHIRKELEKASREGYLSEKGERFLSLTDTVLATTDNRWGALNDVGIMEEKRLATEMAGVAPMLFKSGKVKAEATYVPRVVMTMYEFCHQLACISDNLEISTSEGKQFNSLLRYFTTDSAYVAYLKDKNAVWRSHYDSFAAQTLPTRPAQSFFNKKMSPDLLRKLSLEAYGVLQSLPAAGIVADRSMWFSEKNYRKCWEVSNLEHYYERSANPFSSLPAESAWPLLESLISTTDAALSGSQDEIAFLRFGHAETLLPLFSLMRLPGCYAPEATPPTLASEWIDSDVTPLGANLMMVVLRDTEGKGYVALRLNGRWIPTDGEKVISWPRLRSLWQALQPGS